MLAIESKFRTVEELMGLCRIDLDELVRSTGVERRIVDAIACQRYTPSPQQRERVSRVLCYPRNQIVWGHQTIVEDNAQPRL
jgi:hypothetical protein